VAEDGTISDVVADTNHGYGMEEESIRVIIKSGKWTPATQNGRNVNSYKRQSITFVVS
jgi:protein TonB